MKRADRFRVLAALVGGFAMLVVGACGPSSRGAGDDDDGDDDGHAGGGDAGDGPVFVDAGADAAETTGEYCSSLTATVRDFHRTHPDFETFNRDEIYPGIVQSQLGADGKPVYASSGATLHTSGPGAFLQWYNDVAGVNQAMPVVITLTETAPGLYAFDSDDFFPIDGMGFGHEGFNHNFHFTTEIHTSFEYVGGEVFTFRGDDDLWLFINGKLAIDLGGLHQPAMRSVNLDARAAELGLVVGGVYPMDIFHAERHTIQSTFHIETTIDCFIVE